MARDGYFINNIIKRKKKKEIIMQCKFQLFKESYICLSDIFFS